jgi:hypothetical protein
VAGVLQHAVQQVERDRTLFEEQDAARGALDACLATSAALFLPSLGSLVQGIGVGDQRGCGGAESTEPIDEQLLAVVGGDRLGEMGVEGHPLQDVPHLVANAPWVVGPRAPRALQGLAQLCEGNLDLLQLFACFGVVGECLGSGGVVHALTEEEVHARSTPLHPPPHHVGVEALWLDDGKMGGAGRHANPRRIVQWRS